MNVALLTGQKRVKLMNDFTHLLLRDDDEKHRRAVQVFAVG